MSTLFWKHSLGFKLLIHSRTLDMKFHVVHIRRIITILCIYLMKRHFD